MAQPVRLELPPGCNGVDTPDRGKVYEPKERGGAVVIEDNPAYARALAAAGLRVLPSKAISLHRRPQPVKTCSCGGLNFADNHTCPRCGADITNVEVVIQ
jgi:hypothetical protein